MALKVGELFASFTLDSSGLDGAVNSAEKTLNSMGDSLISGGTTMTNAVTKPVLSAFKDIYKASTGFETAMSRAFAIRQLDASKATDLEQMTNLQNKAMEVAANTKYSTEEVAGAYEYMAMAGWETSEMLSGLEHIVNLSIASGNDLAAVSDIVTDAMTAFGLAADESTDGINNVAYFSDILAATATHSNTNVELMGETFKYMASQSGAMTYNIKDAAVAIGLMANRGIKASNAGTALKNIMTNMASPTKNMRAAMETLGVALDDGHGNMLSFREVMVNLRKGFSGLKISHEELIAESGKLDAQLEANQISEKDYNAEMEKLMQRAYGAEGALKASTAAALAGKYGMAGLLAIISASDDEFNELCYAIDNATGSTKNMVDIMMNNTEGAVERLKSSVNVLETQLGLLFSDSFRNGVNKLTDLTNKFINLDDETKMGTMRMAALAASIGPTTIGAGKLFKVMGKSKSLYKVASALSFMNPSLGLAAIGMLALGAAAIDTNNSIGKTFEKGMTAANESLATFAANFTDPNNQTKLKKGAHQFMESLRTSFDKDLPGIMDSVGTIVSTGLNDLATTIPDAGNLAGTLITTLANGLARNAPAIAQGATNLLTNLNTTMITLAPTLLTAGITIAEGLFDAFTSINYADQGTKIRDAIVTSFGEAKKTLSSKLFGDEDDHTWDEIGEKMVGKLEDGVKAATKSSRDWFGSLVLGKDYNPDDSWEVFGGKVIDAVFEGVSDGVDGAESFVGGVLDGLGDVFSDANVASATTALSSIAEHIVTGVADEIPHLTTAAGNILTKIGELIFGTGESKGLAASAIEGAGSLAGALLNAIAEGLPKAEAGAETIINAVAGMFSEDKLENLTTSLASLAENLITGLASVAAQIVPAVGKLLTAVGNALFNEDGGLVVNIADAAADLAEKLADALSEGLITLSEMDTSSLIDAASNMIKGLVLAIPKLVSAGGRVLFAGVNLAGSIVEELAKGFKSDNVSFDDAATNVIEGLKTSLTGGADGADYAYIGSAITNGIGDVLPKLIDETGNIISAGAAIGANLMQSITDAFTNADGTALGTKIGTATSDILSALLNGTTDLANDANVTTFMTNLGNALNSAVIFIGDVGSAILNHVFSPQFFAEVQTAAKSIAKLIGKTINHAILGDEKAEYFDNMLDDIYNQGGLLNAYNNQFVNKPQEVAGQQFADTMVALGKTFFNADDVTEFITESGERINKAALRAEAKQEWASNHSWLDNFIAEFLPTSAQAQERLQFIDDYISDFLEAGERAIDDVNAVYEDVEDAVNSNTQVSRKKNIVGEGEITLTPQINTEAAAEQTPSIPVDLELNNDTTEFIRLVENDLSAQGTVGMTVAITEETGSGEAAALEYSDAVVQEFLATLTYANGQEIGRTFATAVTAAISAESGNASSASSAVGKAATNSLISAASSHTAYNIGQNFGQGFVNGISSMVSAAAQAAAAMGTAAGEALSTATQEGSPSKWTAEIGRNFDFGFINGIIEETDSAIDAAERLGTMSGEQLEDIVHSIGHTAADEMAPVAGRYITPNGQYDRETGSIDPIIERYTGRIVAALEQVGVYMDSEPVGRLTSGTVSETIAHSSAKRRYATV